MLKAKLLKGESGLSMPRENRVSDTISPPRRWECGVIATALLAFGASALAGLPMEDLAESMPAGSWAELNTSGTSVFGANNNSIFEFSDEIMWDTINRRALFLGTADPVDGPNDYGFVQYDAATNTWTDLPYPSFGYTSNPGHAYGHHAISVQQNKMWYRTAGPDKREFWAYDLSANSWSRVADISGINYVDWASAMQYFPERGTVVLHSGQEDSSTGGVAEYNPNTNSWSGVPFQTSPKAVSHVFTEYSPVHGIVMFGGGDQNNNFWTMNASGVVTQTAAIPSGSSARVVRSILTVDPVSGNFLYLGDDGIFWEYHPGLDSWGRISTGTAPPYSGHGQSAGTSPLFHAVATPVPNYGVVMVVQYRIDGSKVWLYKHAPSEIDRTPPDNPASVNVQ